MKRPTVLDAGVILAVWAAVYLAGDIRVQIATVAAIELWVAVRYLRPFAMAASRMGIFDTPAEKAPAKPAVDWRDGA